MPLHRLLTHRGLRRLLLTLALLITLGGLASWLAVRQLHAALLQALGPRAHIGAVRLGLRSLEVHELQLGAAPGWPAQDELQARLVRVQPDLGSLFGGPWRLNRITVEDGHISLLRTRDGRLRLLPGVLEPARTPPAAGRSATLQAAGLAPGPTPTAAPPLVIERIELSGVQVDWYDASLPGAKPHHLQLADLDARVGPLRLPALDQALQIELSAVFKGPSRDGRLTLAGTLTPASRDARLRAQLTGADLLALQPYLLKAVDGGVRQGTLDLQMDATVRQQHLVAPGRVTLTGLRLNEGRGAWDRFAGLPRQAVLSALQRQDRIALNFTLEGRLDDPAFSVNDNLARRFAAGLAESLGVSIGGVVEGLGQLFKGLLGR
jgi:hypothetical protein